MGDRKSVKSLLEMLKISPEKHRLIGIVGAGGKTTLIYLLAGELREQGYSAAVTTTTHMQCEGRYGFTPIGSGYEGGKVKGISKELPRLMLEKYDIVLVEADGSRCLPFKVPAEHEPVLPAGADLVIGVAGAGAIGRTFKDACHRYETACRHFECGMDDKITERHVLESLTGDFGQKKGVDCEYRYLLNQVDLLEKGQIVKIEEMQKQYEDYGCLAALGEFGVLENKSVGN